jgi:SAM-dependent methyltransferase
MSSHASREPLLSQSRSPWLWSVFQYLCGGTVDKRRLCLQGCPTSGRVLEVGCSTGNIARAFAGVPGISYTGVDIDAGAIAHARRAYRRESRLAFVVGDIRDAGAIEGGYDYVLLAGICHHMADDDCRAALASAARYVGRGGTLSVVDPVLPTPSDPPLYRLFLRLEQGRHMRSAEDLARLVREVPGLSVVEEHGIVVGATPLSVPKCARFAVLLCRPA